MNKNEDKNKKLDVNELENISGGNIVSKTLKKPKKNPNNENYTRVVGLLKMYGGPNIVRTVGPKMTGTTPQNEDIDDISGLSGDTSSETKK